MEKKAQEIIDRIHQEMIAVINKYAAMTDEEKQAEAEKAMQTWWKEHIKPVERSYITIKLDGENDA